MATLLYDADCGFCTRSAGWVRRLGSQVETVPWQGWPRLAEHGITPEAAGEALHVVLDDGSVRVGHEAVAAALGLSRRRLVRAAGRTITARAVAPLSARVYAWVAAHRQSLPGGTPACAVDEPAR